MIDLTEEDTSIAVETDTQSLSGVGDTTNYTVGQASTQHITDVRESVQSAIPPTTHIPHVYEDISDHEDTDDTTTAYAPLTTSNPIHQPALSQYEDISDDEVGGPSDLSVVESSPKAQFRQSTSNTESSNLSGQKVKDSTVSDVNVDRMNHSPDVALPCTTQDLYTKELFRELEGRGAIYTCECGVVTKDQVLYMIHRGSHARDKKQCTDCGLVAETWTEFHTHSFLSHSQ